LAALKHRNRILKRHLDAQIQENRRLNMVISTNPPKKPKMTSVRRMRLAASQHWKCKKCDKELDEVFEADHIKPWCEYSDDSDENIQILCAPCHREKTVVETMTRVLV
jgi:5-methylcytosine-specific restriction endonuclease McrA